MLLARLPAPVNRSGHTFSDPELVSAKGQDPDLNLENEFSAGPNPRYRHTLYGRTRI